jgi:hypothetical protein
MATKDDSHQLSKLGGETYSIREPHDEYRLLPHDAVRPMMNRAAGQALHNLLRWHEGYKRLGPGERGEADLIVERAARDLSSLFDSFDPEPPLV